MGYNVIRIQANKEFESLIEIVEDKLRIEVNVYHADKHIGDIERFNRFLQEGILFPLLSFIYIHRPKDN